MVKKLSLHSEIGPSLFSHPGPNTLQCNPCNTTILSIMIPMTILVLGTVVSVYTSDGVLIRVCALSKRFLVSVGFISVNHLNSSEIEVSQKGKL